MRFSVAVALTFIYKRFLQLRDLTQSTLKRAPRGRTRSLVVANAIILSVLAHAYHDKCAMIGLTTHKAAKVSPFSLRSIVPPC
jgi:hypothetical protein